MDRADPRGTHQQTGVRRAGNRLQQTHRKSHHVPLSARLARQRTAHLQRYVYYYGLITSKPPQLIDNVLLCSFCTHLLSCGTFRNILKSRSLLADATGERWHQHRKLITPTFHFNILDGFCDVFAENSEEMVEYLRPHADTGKPVNVYPFIAKAALDIICGKCWDTSGGINRLGRVPNRPKRPPLEAPDDVRVREPGRIFGGLVSRDACPSCQHAL